MIALAFERAGRCAYGDYLLDRPPLLLALYGVASTDLFGTWPRARTEARQ
jgi:hypothetical protein